ncbi:MAG: hypothetical protein WC107_05915 [Patescibacteria group bacterium]
MSAFRESGSLQGPPGQDDGFVSQDETDLSQYTDLPNLPSDQINFAAAWERFASQLTAKENQKIREKIREKYGCQPEEYLRMTYSKPRGDVSGRQGLSSDRLLAEHFELPSLEETMRLFGGRVDKTFAAVEREERGSRREIKDPEENPYIVNEPPSLFILKKDGDIPLSLLNDLECPTIINNPRFRALVEKLVGDWREEHGLGPDDDIYSESNQSEHPGLVEEYELFLNGNPLAPKGSRESLYERAEKLFYLNFPEEEERIGMIEDRAIYQEVIFDPAIKQYMQDILAAILNPENSELAAERIEETVFNDFHQRFPEKSQVYEGFLSIFIESANDLLLRVDEDGEVDYREGLVDFLNTIYLANQVSLIPGSKPLWDEICREILQNIDQIVTSVEDEEEDEGPDLESEGEHEKKTTKETDSGESSTDDSNKSQTSAEKFKANTAAIRFIKILRPFIKLIKADTLPNELDRTVLARLFEDLKIFKHDMKLQMEFKDQLFKISIFWSPENTLKIRAQGESPIYDEWELSPDGNVSSNRSEPVKELKMLLFAVNSLPVEN